MARQNRVELRVDPGDSGPDITVMPMDSNRPFNAVAKRLGAKERKALVESIWAGESAVVPDLPAVNGEVLYYVGFPGSTRDGIPTQHYMVGARDEGAAIARAHDLYQRQPRIRKGASLRVMLGRPKGT